MCAYMHGMVGPSTQIVVVHCIRRPFLMEYPKAVDKGGVSVIGCDTTCHNGSILALKFCGVMCLQLKQSSRNYSLDFVSCKIV